MKIGLGGLLLLAACGGSVETQPLPVEHVDDVSGTAFAVEPTDCHATGGYLSNWPELSTPYNGHVFVFECRSGVPEGECRWLTNYPDGRVAYGCQRVGDELPTK
jgi:hypothetical protein